MVKQVLTLILVCAVIGVVAPAARADALDDYLQPRCGVDDHFPLDMILGKYQDEIIARASGYQVLDHSAQNQTLMWLLGALKTPAARAVSEQVMTSGIGQFERHLMGAAGARPDWGGVRLIAIGATDKEQMTRDSASSILADLDFTVLDPHEPNAAANRKAAIDLVTGQIPRENDPRLRGNLQAALAKLQATSTAQGS